jgi:hypothetical protein
VFVGGWGWEFPFFFTSQDFWGFQALFLLYSDVMVVSPYCFCWVCVLVGSGFYIYFAQRLADPAPAWLPAP